MAAKRVIPSLDRTLRVRDLVAAAYRLEFEGADELLLAGDATQGVEATLALVKALSAGLGIPLVVHLDAFSPEVGRALLGGGADRLVIPESCVEAIPALARQVGPTRVTVEAALDTVPGGLERMLALRDSGAGEILLRMDGAPDFPWTEAWEAWGQVSLPMAVHLGSLPWDQGIEVLRSGADALYLGGSDASETGRIAAFKAQLAQAGLSVRI
jgi:imidazole glycerol phosphate synthase subunit HisF